MSIGTPCKVILSLSLGQTSYSDHIPAKKNVDKLLMWSNWRNLRKDHKIDNLWSDNKEYICV